MSEHEEFLPLENVVIETNEEIHSLAKIISLLLTSETEYEKYSISINDQIKRILSMLLEEIDYFGKLEEYVNLVIKDGEINAEDIPILMLVLGELYTRVKKLKSSDFSLDHCGDIIKLIFEICIKEKIIPLTKNETQTLSILFNIVQVSMQLINLQYNEDSQDDSSKPSVLSCLYKKLCKCIS